MWDLTDLPGEVQRGAAYASIPLLSVEGDEGSPSYQPITVSDETNRARVYLPTWQSPGLVVATFEGNLVWVAPLLTEANFQNLQIARAIISRA